MTAQCSNQQPETLCIQSQPTGQDTVTPLYSEEMVMLQKKKKIFQVTTNSLNNPIKQIDFKIAQNYFESHMTDKINFK